MRSSDKLFRSALAAAVALMGAAFLPTTAHAADPTCEVDRPVRFGGMNWESNLMLVGVQRFIVEKGYGCDTRVESGETLPMLAAMVRGDVDVNSEIWANMMGEPWDKAVAEGSVVAVGNVFTGRDGWYIPRHTAERHPGLRKATDLKQFKEFFPDPEQPGKARLYSCPVGWVCGTLNENLAKALDLTDDFTVYAPGNAAAQRAAITSAIRRKQDIVFYYWTPTPLAASLDLVKLEQPAFDENAYRCMADPNCQDPKPTDFRANPVVTGLNAKFAESAPRLKTFFGKVNVPDAPMTDTLGWMDKEKAEVEQAAQYFLRNHREVWQAWVPADVAKRVDQAL